MEDWKICSPFSEQFDVFYQREVKEKENRTGASGGFLNGCPKRSDAKRQTGAWYIAHLKQKR